MNREVDFEAIWKRVTEGLSDKRIKLLGKKALKSLYAIYPYDYSAGMAYCEGRLKSTTVDSITQKNWLEVFEWLYFYRFAKKPNFIVTLMKKYLYW